MNILITGLIISNLTLWLVLFYLYQFTNNLLDEINYLRKIFNKRIDKIEGKKRGD